MTTEGILSQLQQRKGFHPSLPSFNFSRFNGHHCSWMNTSGVYFTLSTSNHTHYGCNICSFFSVDGWLLCHCIQSFAGSVFCEFVSWLLDNFSCLHSAASYIINAVKGGWSYGKASVIWLLNTNLMSSTAACLVYNLWAWTHLFNVSKWWITFKLWEIQMYM